MRSRRPPRLIEPRLAPVRPWVWALGMGLLVLALLLDGWVLGMLPRADRRLSEFQRLFRVAGFPPTWLLYVVVSVCAAAGPRRRAVAAMSGIYVLLSVCLSGGIAAALKIVFRRPDPRFGHGYHGWHTAPLGEQPFDGTDFCFPSEHAAVSFGAVLMLARLYPGAALPLLSIGFGTASVRVYQWGHHPSDTAASLLVALGVVVALPRLARLTKGRLVRGPQRLDASLGAAVASVSDAAEHEANAPPRISGGA